MSDLARPRGFGWGSGGTAPGWADMCFSAQGEPGFRGPPVSGDRRD